MNPFLNYQDSQQTTRCLARDAKDREIDPLSPNAVKGVYDTTPFRNYLRRQFNANGYINIHTLNDCDRKPFSWFARQWEACFGKDN